MQATFILVLSVAVSAQQVYISVQGPSARPYCSTTPVSFCTPSTAAVASSEEVLQISDGQVQASARSYSPAAPENYASTPTYYFSEFSYTQTETVRTASAVNSTSTAPFAPPFASLSHLLGSISTTSWGNWDPNSTATATDASDSVGQAAFSSIWKALPLPSFNRGLYSTTVSPTAIPTGQLVLPPPLYFGPINCYTFPKDFILGVAGSASQTEGAIADEGRTPAVVDLASLGTPNATNFVTEENYYLYKQDITRLAAIGIKYYSFSIPWSRVIPFAFPGTPVNSDAIKHYDDLINFIISKGMVPVVTLMQFDTPIVLFGDNLFKEVLGRSYYQTQNFGFGLPEFQEAFVNYGKVVMAHFADRVPIWFTYNEPQVGTVSGPAIYNVIKSHARLAHFYKESLNGTGKISIKMELPPGVPLNPRNATHVTAAQHYNDYWLGTFLNPLALGKDYPEVYKLAIQDYVPLTPADLKYINGTMDFISIDAYTEYAIFPIAPDSNYTACLADNSTSNKFYPTCVGSTSVTANGWDMGQPSFTSFNTAPYFRSALNYIWNIYKMPIMVTEIGTSDTPTSGEGLSNAIYDVNRSEFYLSHLNEILKAIWEDGVYVMGAFAWSWVDNWEFGTFSTRFGMQFNNRTTQERTYKRSFFDYIDFVESRRQT